MTLSEFGKVILKAISKACCTEESLNHLKDNYVKTDDLYIYRDKLKERIFMEMISMERYCNCLRNGRFSSQAACLSWMDEGRHLFYNFNALFLLKSNTFIFIYNV